jgi:hypothetical protein
MVVMRRTKIRKSGDNESPSSPGQTFGTLYRNNVTFKLLLETNSAEKFLPMFALIQNVIAVKINLTRFSKLTRVEVLAIIPCYVASAGPLPVFQMQDQKL